MNMEEEDQFYKSKLKRLKRSEDDGQVANKEVVKESKEASDDKKLEEELSLSEMERQEEKQRQEKKTK